MAKVKATPRSRKIRGRRSRVNARAQDTDKTSSLRPGLSCPVVAIGASAGGLAAFTELLKALPAKSGMAFVAIQHLEPSHESALTNLLSKATAMPVVEVSDGIAVEPNCVYVIPPNKDMTIRKGTLRLAPRSDVSGPQHPIDDFCIGAGGGTGQCSHWRGPLRHGVGRHEWAEGHQGAGGVTFAQEPKTAQWPAMPLSAIGAGSVDFVLSPKEIAAELARIGRHPYLAEGREVPEGSELERICLILRSSTGIDFRLYKQATVRRRIARRMALQKIASLTQYAQILRRRPEEAQVLADDIFIHVTSFFRDPECFEALRKRVLAKMGVKRSGWDSLRIWVAGCSSGEEAYSIAMLLLEELGERADRIKIQIFGTDIQERRHRTCASRDLHRSGGRRSFAGAAEALFRQVGAGISDPEVRSRLMHFCAARSGQGPAVFEIGSDQLPERADLHGPRTAKESAVDFPVCAQAGRVSFPGKLGNYQRRLRRLHGGGPEASDLPAQAGHGRFSVGSSRPRTTSLSRIPQRRGFPRPPRRWISGRRRRAFCWSTIRRPR